MPLISIDLEPKGLYNASRCAYIINVRPFPRREGNCAWAPSLAQAVTLDSRSVETGRSPSYLSIMLHIHCFYSLHSIPRLISRLYISSKDIPYYCKPHDLCWESSLWVHSSEVQWHEISFVLQSIVYSSIYRCISRSSPVACLESDCPL